VLIRQAAGLVGELCDELRRRAAEEAWPEGPAGDVPRLVLAGTAAVAELLRALDVPAPAGLTRADARLWSALLAAVALEHLDTLVHAAAGLGEAAEAFRRQAAGLLAATPGPAGAYRRYARRVRADWKKARRLLRVEGDQAGLAQRQALLPEWEELHRGETRLGQLVESWQASVPAGEEEQALDAEIAEEVGRQQAHLAASALLLLRTHARLEEAPDAAVEMALLRVVLDDAAAELDVFAALVERRLQPASRPGQRPVVEPGFDLPPANLQEFLAAADSYQSGDFVLGAVDLLRPRLTPEMAGEQPLPQAGWLGDVAGQLRRQLASCQAAQPRRRRSRAEQERADALAWRVERLEEDLFVAEALACAAVGQALRGPLAAGELEAACGRFVAGRLLRHAERLCIRAPGGDAPPPGGTAFALERTAVLGRLRALLMARCLTGMPALRPRHVSPEALEMDALKGQVRRQAAEVMPLLSRPDADAGLRLLGLALAGSVAWLWGADCTLGRLAWISRTRLAVASEEPEALPAAGQRAFARCLAEIRTRVQRLDEDLVALRRGYEPPQARAAGLLLAGQKSASAAAGRAEQNVE
jgi:hypothetical protein